MAIEFNLFENVENGVDAWKKRFYAQKEQHPDVVTKWLKNSNQATVEVVLQNEKPAQERVHDFYDAQRELAQDLPTQCKEGGRMDGATVEISEMQLHNESEFSDQAFKPQTKANTSLISHKIYHTKCGHYTDLKPLSHDDQECATKASDDYCFACKISIGGDLNPKPDFVSFLKKQDEMTAVPSSAFDLIYPMPFGCTSPPHPATQPTSSLPEGSLANDSAKNTFQDMQKDNNVDYIGDKYLPKSTQDSKHDSYLPPPYRLSSGSTDTKLGCLMAMMPIQNEDDFLNFAKQNIDPNSLHEKGYELESHISACYGFDDNMDIDKLEKLLGGTGPLHFNLGEIGRFKNGEYDVLYFSVESPDLEALNAKICREFADHIDNSNQKYIPHLTLAYVKPGTNTHLDGKIFKQRTFKVSNLLYSGPNKNKRQTVSLAWDGVLMDDGGFQDGVGEKGKLNPQPLTTNVGDALQAFLMKRSADKEADNDAVLKELKKPFGHQKQV